MINEKPRIKIISTITIIGNTNLAYYRLKSLIKSLAFLQVELQESERDSVRFQRTEINPLTKKIFKHFP